MKTTPAKECDVCYDTVTEEKLFVCGNDNCNFNMCTECGKTYNSPDCPQCRQKFKHNHFKIKPNRQNIHRDTSHSCCIIYNDYPSYDQISIYMCNSTTGCTLNKTCTKAIASRLCCCFNIASYAMIPKMLGYYMCAGKFTTPITAMTQTRNPCEICVGCGVITTTLSLTAICEKNCYSDSDPETLTCLESYFAASVYSYQIAINDVKNIFRSLTCVCIPILILADACDGNTQSLGTYCNVPFGGWREEDY